MIASVFDRASVPYWKVRATKEMPRRPDQAGLTKEGLFEGATIVITCGIFFNAKSKKAQKVLPHRAPKLQDLFSQLFILPYKETPPCKEIPCRQISASCSSCPAAAAGDPPLQAKINPKWESIVRRACAPRKGPARIDMLLCQASPLMLLCQALPLMLLCQAFTPAPLRRSPSRLHTADRCSLLQQWCVWCLVVVVRVCVCVLCVCCARVRVCCVCACVRGVCVCNRLRLHLVNAPHSCCPVRLSLRRSPASLPTADRCSLSQHQTTPASRTWTR